MIHPKLNQRNIAERLEKASISSAEIHFHHDAFRHVALRAALLCFFIVDLDKIDQMYQFSLSSFITVFVKAMDVAEKSSNLVSKENVLIDSITHSI